MAIASNLVYSNFLLEMGYSKFVQVKDSLVPWPTSSKYCKTSNIRRALVGNRIADYSDVFGASPVGAAPTTSLFSK